MTSATNHREFIVDMVRENGWASVAEVGCGSGKLLARLAALETLQFVAGVDLGIRADRRKNLKAIAEENPLKVELRLMDSPVAARCYPDGFFDMIFIDAGHSHDAVMKDIAAWSPKVRAGGVLLGHDYHPKFLGVILAVNESFKTGAFELLPFHIWKVQK